MDIVTAAVGLVAVVLAVLFALKTWTATTAGKYTSRKRMDGKTVIITGANAGIGRETARDLAHRGARVIMACRSLDRGREALQDITSTTGSDKVVLMKCDLASYKSVREFCDQVKQREQRLDVLVLNAGLIAPRDRFLTEDGHELQLQSNHLGN